MARITTEGTPVALVSEQFANPIDFPVSASGHLLLVFENNLGREFVIRGGPTRDIPDPGPLTLEINEPIETSIDARFVRDNQGNIVPVTAEFRGSTLVPFTDGRLPEDIWTILRQHAVNIDIERFPYVAVGSNSNATVGSLLDLVGINVNNVLPNPRGAMLLPYVSKDLVFQFDYTIDGTPRRDKLVGRGGNQVFNGNAGDDTLFGGLGNDSLTGGQGNDILDGGQGIDSAFYTGASFEYNIDFNIDTNTVVITDSLPLGDGVDTLNNIEFAVFSDRTIDISLAVASPIGPLNVISNNTDPLLAATSNTVNDLPTV